MPNKKNKYLCMNTTSEKRYTYIGIALFSVILCVIAIISKGTGDDGDSISHFIYSRDVFLYPKNFFNHWAKPLFVLISAPFAQFGLVGLKLMNVATLTLSLILTYQLACRWKMPHAWLAPFFMFAQHRVWSHTLSGLTEPLFALFLIFTVWLYQRKQFLWATLLVSFLPFVRSEGLIIFCVLPIYLIVRKQWKYIPLLAVGHLVYAVAGSGQHKSLLWVFNTMSYATLDHVYGVGKWHSFILDMPWVVGGFVYTILIIGLFEGLRRLVLFLRKKTDFDLDEMWLVYGIFVAYFLAHTIFWMYGIFASQGLMRVMLCVAPMMGLICLRGANAITDWVGKWSNKPKMTTYLQGAFVVLGIVFLYKNLDWRIDFNLHPSQLTQIEAAKKYKHKIDNEGYALYTESLYVDYAFGVNPMEDPRHHSLQEIMKHEPVAEKSILVWEWIFAGGMYKAPYQLIYGDKRFKLIDTFQHEDFIWGGTYKTFIFETDTNYIRQLKASQPLYFNNFEGGNYPNQDNSGTKQSSCIIKLTKENPYAPGMEGAVSNYFTKSEHRFKVSFDLITNDIYEKPRVIFQTMTLAGQSVDWQQIDLGDQLKNADWHRIEVTGTAKNTGNGKDIFKIYVWAPNTTPAYIDNFKVEYAD
jgi:hypothetical protein